VPDRVPVSQPFQWGNERAYVDRAIRENWISSAGEFLERFETAFARYCGCKFGVACMNGTVACHLAFAAAGIEAGDEVICPDFTMMSPVFALLYLGAKPVFVDADPASWTIDVRAIERRITPRTRAILAVHIYGHPCDMDAIREIAGRHGLKVLEDAAEAHGGEVRGKRTGALGDVAAFSFYANKIITTGEGGMVVTNDPGIAERARSLKNLSFGKTPESRFIHEGVGFQYRMTNVQAAIGVAQMEHVDEAVAAKIEIARSYGEALAGIPGATLPPQSSWAKNVYWVYGILIGKAFGKSRREVQARLHDEGIETRTFFYPTHRQKMFAPPAEGFPVSCRLWDEGLYIPSYIGMGDAAIERVAGAIRRIQRS
jgi:perosamine synthetase